MITGITGYKKVKITDENSEIFNNPNVKYEKGNEFAFVPVLD